MSESRRFPTRRLTARPPIVNRVTRERAAGVFGIMSDGRRAQAFERAGGAVTCGQLRKAGNGFVVTIPQDEVDRLQLVERDFVAVELEPRPALWPELRSALDAVWPQLESHLKVLKNR